MMRVCQGKSLHSEKRQKICYQKFPKGREANNAVYGKSDTFIHSIQQPRPRPAGERQDRRREAGK